MIEIKAFYGDWKPASKEKAAAFAKWLMRHMPAVYGEAEKMALIDAKHLRGATARELTCQDGR